MPSFQSKQAFHKIEIIADRLIPYCLVALVVALILELFYHDAIAPYSYYISVLDWIIICIFITDLIFKYIRIHNVPLFLKRYWLEIIACFPAFLIIRMFEEFAILTRLDEGLFISQESIEITEKTAVRANRVHYFGRFMQPLAKIPRFFAAFHFYEHPRHRRFRA